MTWHLVILTKFLIMMILLHHLPCQMIHPHYQNQKFRTPNLMIKDDVPSFCFIFIYKFLIFKYIK